MPDRPLPRNLENHLVDTERRLEAVERQVPLLGEGDVPLQTFEDGSPLGDTLFVDFAAGLRATLIGDRFVRVTGQAGGPGGWDAVVDGNLTASAPENRLFMGIIEALVYLASIGLDSVAVFVKSRQDATAYVEAVGTYVTPQSVLLFGGGQGDDNFFIEWDLTAAAVMTSNARWTVYNMRITCSTARTSVLSSGASYAVLINCRLQSGVPTVTYASFVEVTGFRMEFQHRVADSYLRLVNGDIHFEDDVSVTWPLTTVMRGIVIGGSSGQSASTWTFQADSDTDIELSSASSSSATWQTSDVATSVVTFSIGAGSQFKCVNRNFGMPIRISSPSASTCDLEGHFDRVTLAAPPTGSQHHLGIDEVGLLDLTGPAVFNMSLRNSGVHTFRGLKGSGHISVGAQSMSSGTLLDLINADGWRVDVAHDGTGLSGTAKPYALDASSADNFFTFPNLDAWPVAGTDAGTNNRVETTPGPAGGAAPANADYLVGTAHAGLSAEIVVGTTPAGELGGTWAAPTVDATHSGSAHSDFVPVAGHVNGHVIEDEGVPLTQRADLNFVGAGVTAADSGGKTVVTIPGGGSDGLTAADWVAF